MAYLLFGRDCFSAGPTNGRYRGVDAALIPIFPTVTTRSWPSNPTTPPRAASGVRIGLPHRVGWDARTCRSFSEA